jgi:hypothetical protein
MRPLPQQLQEDEAYIMTIIDEFVGFPVISPYASNRVGIDKRGFPATPPLVVIPLMIDNLKVGFPRSF